VEDSIMSLVVIGGNNRGARAIVNELQDETTRLYDPDWLLADPKDNRAVQMAAVLTKRFPALRPHPLQMRIQDALAYSTIGDTVVLAPDTIEAILQTLEVRLASQRVSYQFAGRGPGGIAGTRLAIQGTIYPGDYETESASQLFLQTFAGMSRSASSRQLTGPDPLSAAVLQPLRQAASRRTARHLAEKEREPQELSGSPLSVMFGPTIYPLIPVQGVPQDAHAQWTARALEAAGGVPAKHVASGGVHGGAVYVAVVIREARAIHFIKVAQNRMGKRSIAGMKSFVSPRVQQQSKSAVVTD
jgi:hypothetical protein